MRRERERDEQSIADTQFIDVLADTQSEPAHTAVDAGIGDLQVLYQDGNISLPVRLTIQTSTGLHRGVHMSRLVKAASSRGAGRLEDWLRRICAEVDKTQPGSRVTCKMDIPTPTSSSRSR